MKPRFPKLFFLYDHKSANIYYAGEWHDNARSSSLRWHWIFFFSWKEEVNVNFMQLINSVSLNKKLKILAWFWYLDDNVSYIKSACSFILSY